MTIALRLVLLIAVSIVSLVLLVAATLFKMESIHHGIVETNTNSIPSIVLLSDAQTAFHRARPPLLSFLMESDPEKKKGFENRITTRWAELEKSLTDYEKLIVDSKDREMLDVNKRLFDEYRTAARRVLSLSAEGRGDEAKRQLEGLRSTIDSLSKALLDHARYNQDMAAKNAVDAEADYLSTRSLVIGVALGAVALMCAFGFIIYRQVTGALAEMVSTFSRVESDLDFTKRIPAHGNDEIAAASRAFNKLIERLQGSFKTIHQQAADVNSAANRVSTAAHEMSVASAHQSDSAASMAASIEELTVSINHVSDRAHETTSLTRNAGQLASEGEGIIGETVGAISSIATRVSDASSLIRELESQSEKISSIVQVIREIADQTNLLALNAAIEAARAGEQGRGFAVVADEVRKLAERTGLSTQEIASTIQAMLSSAQAAVSSMQSVEGSVTAGVDFAERASGAMKEIGSGSSRTVDMVADISDAIREQSEASTSIAQKVESIAQMTEENSAAAESTSDTAGELAQLANQMQGVIAQYRV